MYRDADKFLARPDWKKQLKDRHFSSDAEVIAAAEIGWRDNIQIFFGWLAGACFLPGRAKDLSASRVPIISKLKNLTFCPHCIYVFYLRTNIDLCHLHYKLIGFYNPDEKCLQRGTDWVFKYSGLRFVCKGVKR